VHNRFCERVCTWHCGDRGSSSRGSSVGSGLFGVFSCAFSLGHERILTILQVSAKLLVTFLALIERRFADDRQMADEIAVEATSR
jgi:hypothetical protein